MLLLFLALVLLIPIRIELSGILHGTEFRGSVHAVFLFCLPVDMGIYNLKDKPWKFKVYIFGKARDADGLASRAEKWRLRNESKGRRKLQDMAVLKGLSSAKKYIREIELTGRVGIKERADTTALLAGWLNGILFPMAVRSGADRVKVCFMPEYTKDTVKIKGRCIISANAANIIHEGIRYYLKRRK